MGWGKSWQGGGGAGNEKEEAEGRWEFYVLIIVNEQKPTYVTAPGKSSFIMIETRNDCMTTFLFQLYVHPLFFFFLYWDRAWKLTPSCPHWPHISCSCTNDYNSDFDCSLTFWLPQAFLQHLELHNTYSIIKSYSMIFYNVFFVFFLLIFSQLIHFFLS